MKKIVILFVIVIYGAQLFGQGQSIWPERKSYSNNHYPNFNSLPPGGSKEAVYSKFAIVGTDTLWLDVSGHGRHATLRYAKNFVGTSEWTAGILPYASEVLVVFPSSLLSFDLDSFMFAGGGVARSIPTISFFQDIDYGHKLFCKEIAQVLNSDSTEVHGAGIRYFTIYSAPQTGANLTACNIFFEVPAEQLVNVKWVDPINGSNLNSGSKSLPVKNLTTAQSKASTGYTIYIKNGSFLDGNVSTGYLEIGKRLNIIGVGFVKIGSVIGGTTLIYHHVALGSYKNIIFDGTNLSSRTIMIDAAGVSFYNCQFKNTKTYAITYYSSFSVYNTTFDPNSSYRPFQNSFDDITKEIKINGCYFYGAQTSVFRGDYSNKLTFYYNKLYHCVCSQSIFWLYTNANINIKFNKFINNVDNQRTIYLNSINNTVPINIEYNDFISSANDKPIDGISLTTNTTGILNIIGNNFSNSCLTRINAFVLMKNHRRINLNYNKFSGEAYDESINTSQVCFQSTGAIMDGLNIYSNVFNSKYRNGYIVLIGTDGYSTNNYKISNFNFIGNVVNGFYLNDTYNGLNHALMIGCVGTFVVKNNKFFGCGYSIVVKGKQNANDNDVIIGNLFYKNRGAIVMGGVQNVKIYNNTFQNISSDYRILQLVSLNQDGLPISGTSYWGAINNVFKNNLIQTRSSSIVIDINDNDSNVGNTFDYNDYDCANVLFELPAADYNLTNWQGLGNDVHSKNNSFSFQNIPNYLWPINPITGGEDLGAPYDYGLDISTNWGSSTQIPVIILKQNTNGQIGAYIQ